MPFTIGRPPRDEEELYWYVRARFGFAIPRTPVCPDHVPPFQAFADAYFGRNTRDAHSAVKSLALWHGSRGLSGKSFMLSLLAIVIAELHGADVNLLGGSLAQSLNIHEHVSSMLDQENAPDYMIVQATSSKIVYTNGAKIRPLTASQKTVRGPHPPRLLLDEIDEMDLKILDAALGQPLPQRNYLGRIIKPYAVMCVAGWTQILTPAGEVRIDSISVGDQVMTRAGWRPVLNVWRNGVRPVIDVRLSNGRILTCTPDHRIATPGGWLEARELAVGQEVCGVGPGLIGVESGDAGRTVPLGVETASLASVRNALAGLADSPPALRKSSVLDRELVAPGAVGLERIPGAQGRASVQIDDRRDGLEVGRIAAGEAGAATILDVVDLVAVGDRPDQADVSPAVDLSSMDGSVHHSVAATRSSSPNPAASLVDRAAAQEPVRVVGVSGRPSGQNALPVFDLEVADHHEYVAEYAVIHNCSTWQNAQGTFTAIKHRAEEKGIPVYMWCYRESANPIDGWLTEEAIEEKRLSIPKAMWDTEYELNEPSIGNRAFDPSSIERTFRVQHEPDPGLDPENPMPGGYIRGKIAQDFEEFVYANPLRGAEYVAAADWGKEKDYTVIGVGRVDVQPFELVYYMRVNRRPYPQMVGFFNKAVQRYNARAIHDSTGVGVAVDDYVTTRAQGFSMTGEKRSAMLTEYVSDFENGRWALPRTPTSYTAHKYCQVGDLYRPKAFDDGNRKPGDFHLPDEVCMMALMNHLVRGKPTLVGPPSLERPVGVQTELQRQLDGPSASRRVGDVVRQSDREPAYSLGV